MTPSEQQPFIAIATDSSYAAPLEPWIDDSMLRKELEELGARVNILDWQNKAVDWHTFDAIFVSSTWNIPAFPQAFLSWLNHCSEERKRLINDQQVLIDNVVKSRYLSYLAEKFGDTMNSKAAVTPSAYFAITANEQDATQAIGDQTLEEILMRLDGDESGNWKQQDIILKPIVSADGKDTFVYARTGRSLKAKDPGFILQDASEANQRMKNMLLDADRGIILQPYIQGVEQGEYSLVFLGDRFSHAIQKPGGFRQDSETARIAKSAEELPEGMIAFGEQLIRHMEARYGAGALTRTRVDLLLSGHGFLVCELECTEPNTNIQRLPSPQKEQAFKAYARAVYERACYLRE